MDIFNNSDDQVSKTFVSTKSIECHGEIKSIKQHNFTRLSKAGRNQRSEEYSSDRETHSNLDYYHREFDKKETELKPVATDTSHKTGGGKVASEKGDRIELGDSETPCEGDGCTSGISLGDLGLDSQNVSKSQI